MDEESGRGYATRILPIYNHRRRCHRDTHIHTLKSMDGQGDDNQEEVDPNMDKIRCQSPVPPQWLHLVLENNLTKVSFRYLVIDVAVLVLVTLRRHMLLTLVGPRFLAVVQIGAVGVQRRLQISQQGICNNNNKSRRHILLLSHALMQQQQQQQGKKSRVK